MVVIGIDLGTTYSCVSVFRNGTVEIISNDQGNKSTPSYVAFTSTERLIGESAKYQAALNPENTVYGVKRIIGRRYDDVNVLLDLRTCPFRVVNNNGKPKIAVQYRGTKQLFAPEEISGMVISKLKEVAEHYLREPVSDVVITVPAYFNDSQRQSTRTAGIIAGLNVLRIINEPSAAALAYGVQKKLKGLKNVVVFDFGGGSVDVSVLRIEEGPIFKVLSTAGNTRLGGEDLDIRLATFFLEDFRKIYGSNILSSSKAVHRLRTAAEKAKRCLTSAMETSVHLECLHNGLDYSGKITRAMFEDLCSDVFKDTLKPIEQALNDAKIPKNHIHEIILVGGSSRIPIIQKMLQEYFGKKHVSLSVNPDEAVAFGAAIQGAMLSGQGKDIQDLTLSDVVPLSLGIETARGLMFKVIERNSSIPCRNNKEITTLEHNQMVMTIEVFEGERALTKDNNLLGVFELSGILPAPRGVPKIDLIFDVDANGILTVIAQDKTTGNCEGIVIRNESRLTAREIEKMVAQANVFKEDDKERIRCLESRNQLETYIYSVKQTINENGDKLTSDEREDMVQEYEKAISWLDMNGDSLREEFERKLTELLNRWSKVMAKIYEPLLRSDNHKRHKKDPAQTISLEVLSAIEETPKDTN